MLDSIPSRLLNQALQHPHRAAYHVRTATGWTSTNWREYVAQIRMAARAWIALGIQRDSVAIVGFNRPEWTIIHHSAMLIGGAGVGIYTTSSSEEIRYILEHCEAPYVVIEHIEQWQKIEPHLHQLPTLRKIVFMGECSIDHPQVLGWEDFLQHGKEISEASIDERLAQIQETDIGTLIYTSGTTGPPKAVMLSHRNLAWTAKIALEVVQLGPDDSTLSYLPLSHIAEQMFTIHAAATIGYQVYFAQSLERLPDNLREVRPTLMFGVPRVWEKAQSAIQLRLDSASVIRKWIARWAMRIGLAVSEIKNRGQNPGFWLGLQYRIVRRFIFEKAKAAMGLDRARYCVSGAAPIQRDVLEFFASLDLTILEVYGQSEGSGPTTFNRPGRTKFGTVGPPVPHVDVQIAEDGEVLVRGPNVFAGYYRDPLATSEALNGEWLHSGDLGRFDDDGYLILTGRKKEIIITAGGKNISPKNIEAALQESELIAEAIVFGDRRKFLSALLWIEPRQRQQMGTSEELNQAVQAAVDRANTRFAPVEQIRLWRLLPRPLSVEHGELTPTLKVKRKKVEAHFQSLIEEIYAETE